jgi:hypothetical protein
MTRRRSGAALQRCGRRAEALRHVSAIAIGLSMFTLLPVLQPRVDAQLPAVSDNRYAGLQWRFVRIKYHYQTEGSGALQDFYGEPWYIDAPAAEQNLSRRIKTATAIQVADPLVLTLDDKRLFEYPWIYIVEAGNLKMLDSDVATLREFLLRGGSAMIDDTHGPADWDNIAREMKRVFPDRDIVEVPKDHPVFSSFYKIDSYPQVAGRPMIFINWNTDMGDGWEWSNAEEYPGYLKFTALAYKMGINEIVYSLTH